MALVMYVKPNCPYCQQARDFYKSKGVKWTEYDAQNDRARRAEMFALSERERSWIGQLVRGRALWRLQRRGAVVQTVLTTTEAELCDTDAAMGT